MSPPTSPTPDTGHDTPDTGHDTGGHGAVEICFAPCEEDCVTIRYFVENDFEGCIPGHFDQYSSHGSLHDIVKAALYICMVISILQILFYGFQWWRKTCGWEVWFVACIETSIYIIAITSEADSPFTLYLTNGQISPQLRYMEWLMTCPVILIALSNITGMAEEYNKRTMTLLTSDVCCIVLGMMSAASKPRLKGILYAVGWAFGAWTYWTALQVYRDAHKAVPKPLAWYVRAMGYVFFTSWLTFPGWFLLGPEGLEVVTGTVSTLMHACSDLISKNLWGFMDWHLRVLVARHHRKLFKAEEEHALKKGQTLEPGMPRSTSFVRGLGDDVEIDPSYELYRLKRQNHPEYFLSPAQTPRRGPSFDKRTSFEMDGGKNGMLQMMPVTGMGMGMGMGMGGGKTVLFLDYTGGGYVSFFEQQLSNMGVNVTKCWSDDDMYNTAGVANVKQLFHFAMIPNNALGGQMVMDLRGTGLLVVAYGPEPPMPGMGQDEFVPLQMPGVPYDESILHNLVMRHAITQGLGMNGMQGNMGQQQQMMGMQGNMNGMQGNMNGMQGNMNGMQGNMSGMQGNMNGMQGNSGMNQGWNNQGFTNTGAFGY